MHSPRTKTTNRNRWTFSENKNILYLDDHHCNGSKAEADLHVITTAGLIPTVEHESVEQVLQPKVVSDQYVGMLRIGQENFVIYTTNGDVPLFTAEYGSIDRENCHVQLVNPPDREKRALQTKIRELEKTNSSLEELVNSDALTGLLNRRGLVAVLKRELSYARRTKSTLLAALVDLDNFKAINDNYGYEHGDQVLKIVASVISERIRGSDWPCRVGGDEFLVLLPCTQLQDGVAVLDRVRKSIAEKKLMTARGFAIPMTVSIGVAPLTEKITAVEDVLRVTGRGLRASKSSGKNRISVLSDEESSHTSFDRGAG